MLKDTHKIVQLAFLSAHMHVKDMHLSAQNNGWKLVGHSLKVGTLL